MTNYVRTDQGAALDRDYMQGQVDYQKGNAALFQYEIQYGTDPDLKEFARRTLPIIEDHLQRALTVAKSSETARKGGQKGSVNGSKTAANCCKSTYSFCVGYIR
jgi:uncharacterized protein DUF4142